MIPQRGGVNSVLETYKTEFAKMPVNEHMQGRLRSRGTTSLNTQAVAKTTSLIKPLHTIGNQKLQGEGKNDLPTLAQEKQQQSFSVRKVSLLATPSKHQ